MNVADSLIQQQLREASLHQQVGKSIRKELELETRPTGKVPLRGRRFGEDVADDLIRQALHEHEDVARFAWVDPHGVTHSDFERGPHNQDMPFHEAWVADRFRGKPTLDSTNAMYASGWLRKADNNSYQVGHENHISKVVSYVRRHHRELEHVFVDVGDDSALNLTSYRVPMNNPSAKEKLSESAEHIDRINSMTHDEARHLARAVFGERVRVIKNGAQHELHMKGGGGHTLIGYGNTWHRAFSRAVKKTGATW